MRADSHFDSRDDKHSTLLRRISIDGELNLEHSAHSSETSIPRSRAKRTFRTVPPPNPNAYIASGVLQVELDAYQPEQALGHRMASFEFAASTCSPREE
jgi:hypothetical protein